MKLESLGEFGLIQTIRAASSVPDGVLGIGDDCAVIPQTSGMDSLVSTDMLVEGTHFLTDSISAYQLGWKSAAVNISDIAAMGGKPVATFLSFALRKNLPDGWIEDFMRGYADISAQFGVALLGGDTTSSPDRLCINVTVLGSCQSGKALKRSGARIGDLVCVTGNLGDSAAGLRIVLDGLEHDSAGSQYLLARHLMPTPRVSEGLSLASCPGVHAMMDISDGIASDLRHIMEESGVGAEVDMNSLPLSAELMAFCNQYGLNYQELAVSGGEDYELLFTMDPATRTDVPHTVIGRIVPGEGLVWIGANPASEYTGFRHF